MYGPFSHNMQYLHYCDVDAQVRMWCHWLGIEWMLALK